MRLRFGLLALAVAYMPTAPLAEGQKTCVDFGVIAEEVAAERRKFKNERKVRAAILAKESDADEDTVKALIQIVGWVYALPRKELKKGVGAALAEACEAGPSGQ